MFAHALGNPPNMDQVMRIVEQNNLYLIQDCCDALGSQYMFNTIDATTVKQFTQKSISGLVNKDTVKLTIQTVTQHRVNKKLGTFGNLATYSFYPAHHMSTGQGGFITTDDYLTYKTLISFRDWGRACNCRGKQDAMKQNGRCGRRFGEWLTGAPGLE